MSKKNKEKRRNREEDEEQEEKKEVKPRYGEYKGKPTISLPLVPNADKSVPWHWLTFGLSKARTIVYYFSYIQKFIENNSKEEEENDD